MGMQLSDGLVTIYVCRRARGQGIQADVGKRFLRTQVMEFTWLRPNRVVTRPGTAGSGGGIDYLWLRSRTIVKIDARRRAALEHSPEVW